MMSDKGSGGVDGVLITQAWARWLASSEGNKCADYATLTNEEFLSNRLWLAFMAGAAVAEEVAP